MGPCSQCEYKGKTKVRVCDKCKVGAEARVMDIDDTQDEDKESRVRSKSPMVNSGERPGKVFKVDIATPVAPLLDIPAFPKMVSSSTATVPPQPAPPPSKVEEKGKGGKKGPDPWDGKGNCPWGNNESNSSGSNGVLDALAGITAQLEKLNVKCESTERKLDEMVSNKKF